MDTLMTIIYFIIAIGILVLIHEFGHFILARLSGMRAEVFAFGMGYRLFGWNRKIGFTFGSLPDDFDGEGHTDYRLAAFPIGGYVKIAGMVDESMDTSMKETLPQPWEFRSKNAFQKTMAISGGVIMNIVLAIIIFTFLIQSQGQDFKATTTIGSVAEKSIAKDIGFKPGDEVISINDKKMKTWDEFIVTLSIKDMGAKRKIQLIRDGETILLNADGNKIIKDITEKKPIGLNPDNVKVLINAVQTLKPAGKLGMIEDDTVIAVNNQIILSAKDFQKIISSNKEEPVLLTWKRGNHVRSDSITPTSDGIIGVSIAEIYTGRKIHEEYDFFSAVSLGAKETYNTAQMIIGSFSQMISGNVSVTQNLGGPIAIAKMASQQAERGVLNFLSFLALMSVMLAVVNILPFPALDGGHLVIIIIEAIFRREIPLKAKMAIQQVGMFILLAFMAFVFYLDLMR
ncbi:MAG: RIP metalloprotease RseP [bacterium]